MLTIKLALLLVFVGTTLGRIVSFSPFDMCVLGFEIEYYDVPSRFMTEGQNVAQKRAIEEYYIPQKMLRDPGWRHIGLGKRSPPRQMSSAKTWSMIGLGR